MALEKYNAKRSFNNTPEPRGESRRGRSPLRFVVQKHAASRLHYDFRLELDGVLKSWAIPKCPSLNPRDKRLAIHVEDHPLDYRTFEGVIPEGNYGAGTVMVWDEGTYHAPGAVGRVQSEPLLREGLARGRLSLVLEGEKLRGEFSLVKIRRGEENAWLLIKKSGPWASDADVTAEGLSVTSGRTLEEIAGNRPRRARGSPTGTRQTEKRRLKVAALEAPEAPMPRQV